MKNDTITGIKVRLIGEDGNAFFILGKVTKEMWHKGCEKSVIDAYYKEATSGDYNHLLATTMKYVEIV